MFQPIFTKQFTVRGSQFFLKMCPPFVSLLVSALFRWPCSMSTHLFSKSVRPFPLATQRFYSFVRTMSLLVSALFRWRCNISFHSPHSLPLRRVSQFFLKMCFYSFSFVFKVISLLLSLRFAACTAGVRPFPLAMQHFYSFVSQVCRCWCPPFSAGHAAFLFICL